METRMIDVPYAELVRAYEAEQRRKESRKAYLQTDKGKEYNRQKAKSFYERHKAEILEKRKTQYEENKDVILNRSKAYYEAHKDVIKQKHKEKRKTMSQTGQEESQK